LVSDIYSLSSAGRSSEVSGTLQTYHMERRTKARRAAKMY
jgi:hypothetical protein